MPAALTPPTLPIPIPYFVSSILVHIRLFPSANHLFAAAHSFCVDILKCSTMYPSLSALRTFILPRARDRLIVVA